MMILAAAAGFSIAWVVSWLADYLPRYAHNATELKAMSAHVSPPAVWRVVTNGTKDGWAGLYAAAELLSAVFFAYLWNQTDAFADFALIAGIYSFLLLIAVIDLKYRLVLNVLTYPAIVGVFVYQVIDAPHKLDHILVGGGLVFLMFLIAARLGDLGGGDIKLAALIGIGFGFPQVLWALLVGAGAGAIVAVVLLMTRYGTRKSHMPYAPFLCFGAMVAVLYQPIHVFAA